MPPCLLHLWLKSFPLTKRNDDLILSDFHKTPRKLFTDEVPEYEKSRSKSDSVASVKNTTNAVSHVTVVTSGSTMEPKIVTEVHIASGRSISDPVASDSVEVSKVIPALNTAPSTP